MKKAMLLLSAVAAISFSSCKKDHKDSAGDVTVEFDNVVNDVHIDVTGATPYIDASGDTFTVSKLKYYITNIQLKKKDGTWYSDPESYYLINEADSNARTAVLKDVPGGDYTALRYMVGVDSTRNVSGAQTGALDPANGMFWTWNSGYIFFKAEGNSSAISTSSHAFTYHIGGYQTGVGGPAMRTIETTFGGATLTVDGEREAEIHMTAEFQDFLGNVHMSTTHDVMMPGVESMQFANNYANMFTFEHIHNGE